ncbi:hypothetical protein R3P38DRAFT_3221881 [Favolaschia claudopus]|uniref:Uncharacterized protein n=1 Tax=Favolaschia claudopus TaxID=2862362 RepID=A0AAW0A1C2_9AGAR
MKIGMRLAKADPYVGAVHPISWSVSPDASPPYSSSSGSASASAVSAPIRTSSVEATDSTTQRQPGLPTSLPRATSSQKPPITHA